MMEIGLRNFNLEENVTFLRFSKGNVAVFNEKFYFDLKNPTYEEVDGILATLMLKDFKIVYVQNL